MSVQLLQVSDPPTTTSLLKYSGGCPPRVMGIGPAYAIPMVLRNTGLTAEDVDLYEVSLATC